MALVDHPVIEFVVRFSYYRLGGNFLAERLRNRPARNAGTKIKLGELRSALLDLGVRRGDTVMVHSAMSRVQADAEDVLAMLEDLVGPNGNLLMPTHPQLSVEDGYYVYDVTTSPSRVGVLTEIFRKKPEVLRGRHPFSTVAAWGRDRHELIGDERLDAAPLPHGRFSPYYRFAKANGKVVCIGVTHRQSATIKHTAEEVLDDEFPFAESLFVPVSVVVKDRGQLLFRGTVRRNNVSFSRVFMAKGKMEHEWLKNGLLIRRRISGVPVELVHAKRCVEYMIAEIRRGNSSYPVARWRWRKWRV